MESKKSQGPASDPNKDRLARAAEAGEAIAAGINRPADARAAPNDLAAAVRYGMAASRNEAPCATCKVALKIAIFFDGTGNNLDADVGTQEHSNVARLYRAHVANDIPKGIHRRYVPGLGTYFKDIGDPGDDVGMAFARYGDQRLDWAMKEVNDILARYVPANITHIGFSLFGFSRGAALARAFARKLHARMEAAGGGWRWRGLGCAAEIVFMGIFDTVASVGLAASSNTPVLSAMMAKGYKSIDQGLKMRRNSSGIGLSPVDSDGARPGMALGRQPGADPTAGPVDGHMGWGSDLRLPLSVKRCVHFVAAHEVRNSFPLDSIREGIRLPVGIDVDERVYPGVHSDVGGGYRPGEGGKSATQPELISLVPLNEMLREARSAGIPLNEPKPEDFALSDAMLKRWKAYMAHPSLTGNRPLEAWLLAHMRLYYAWRFRAIRRNQGQPQRADGQTLAQREQVYLAEQKELDRQIAEAEKDPARLAAQSEKEAAQRELDAAMLAQARMASGYGAYGDRQAVVQRAAAAQQRKTAADKAFADADDRRLSLMARRNTLPGTGLATRLDAYDRNLMLDVQAVLEQRKTFPHMPLRPHYVRLMEAYEAEFIRHQGLLDGHPEALEFLELHVHDSLAGFAKDVTLPSDPRMVYVGKDEKIQFAHNEPSPELVASS